MFSSKSRLEKKTGPYGIGRFSYLQSLVNEFQNTDDYEAKKQIMANLANFAYDPINYEHLKLLNILDLFLDGLEETDEEMVEFAIGGLCNACAEKDNRNHVVENGGVKLVISCLSRYSEDIVLSTITTLMHLVTKESRTEITSLPVVECMVRLSQSKNSRLRNLATVFLEDYCNDSVIQEARTMQKNNGFVQQT